LRLTDTHLARAAIAAAAPTHLQAFLASVVAYAVELEGLAEQLERWAFALRSDGLLVEATRARVRLARVDTFLGVE
jgi:hypothetical protein